MEFDQDTSRLRIPVSIEIEPQRIIPDVTAKDLQTNQNRNMAELVRRGLRAQLQTGNLLTGELFVDLTFVRDAPPAELDRSGPVPVIPSVPATLEALQASVTAILNKLASIPVEDLIGSLNRTAVGLDRIVNAPGIQNGAATLGATLASLQGVIARLEADSGPLLGSLTGAAQTASTTMRDLQAAVAGVIQLGTELDEHGLDVLGVDVGAGRTGEQGRQHLAMTMVHGTAFPCSCQRRWPQGSGVAPGPAAVVDLNQPPGRRASAWLRSERRGRGRPRGCPRPSPHCGTGSRRRPWRAGACCRAG